MLGLLLKGLEFYIIFSWGVKIYQNKKKKPKLYIIFFKNYR